MRHRASREVCRPDERYDLDLADVAEVWRRGSVVDVVAARPDGRAHWRRNEQLEGFSGHVEDSGEGRWTIEAAIEEAVPAGVLAGRHCSCASASRQPHAFAEGAVGHAIGLSARRVEAPKK